MSAFGRKQTLGCEIEYLVNNRLNCSVKTVLNLGNKKAVKKPPFFILKNLFLSKSSSFLICFNTFASICRTRSLVIPPTNLAIASRVREL